MRFCITLIVLLIGHAGFRTAASAPDPALAYGIRALSGGTTAYQACTSVAPASVDFGDVIAGESSTLSITISNTGAAEINVTSISTSGPGAAVFDVETSPFTVPPSGSESLSIDFTPDFVGAISATLNLVCDGQAADIPLTGNGIQLLVSVTPLSTPTAGESLSLLATIPDAYSPETQELLFRQSGQTEFQSVAAERQGSQISITLSADALTPRGLEYFFRFTRGANTLTVPGTNPESNPIRLRVRSDQFTGEFAVAPLEYRMISIPVDLDDPTIFSSLEDDFGVYDSTQWRLFRWDFESRRYVEPPILDETFVPGNAFWLNSRIGGSFDVEDGRSVDASVPYSIVLGPGWNQIGVPFAFPVAWSSVVGSDVVESPVSYDGTEYQYGQTVLEPWRGYFVNNPTPTPVVVQVPPIESSIPSGKSSSGLLPTDGGSFGVQLVAEGVESDLRDSQNFVGINTSLPLSGGSTDVVEAPGVGEHLRLSILSGENRLAASFRPAERAIEEWDLEVGIESPTSVFLQRHPIRISLVRWGSWSEGHGVSVQDARTEETLVLRDGALVLNVSPGETRRLRISLGETSQLSAPAGESRAILHAYPNPIADRTRVEYVLDRPQLVTLAVFDALGRRVRMLVEAEQTAGVRSVIWDRRSDSGKQVAPGLYVCVLRLYGNVYTYSLIASPQSR